MSTVDRANQIADEVETIRVSLETERAEHVAAISTHTAAVEAIDVALAKLTGRTVKIRRRGVRGRPKKNLPGNLPPEEHEAARHKMKISKREYAENILGVSVSTYLRKTQHVPEPSA